MSVLHESLDRVEIEGVVGHYSTGGFGQFHRLNCPEAPHRGDPGVRDTIHGPWKYLAAHWAPCPACSPPADVEQDQGQQAA